jgi:hypothetical protein
MPKADGSGCFHVGIQLAADRQAEDLLDGQRHLTICFLPDYRTPVKNSPPEDLLNKKAFNLNRLPFPKKAVCRILQAESRSTHQPRRRVMNIRFELRPVWKSVFFAVVCMGLYAPPCFAADRVFPVPLPSGGDDSVNIQTILNKAAKAFNTSDNAGFSGVAVVFPAGTYIINKRLTMTTTNRPAHNGGIMIRGQGASASVIVSSNSAGALYFNINTTDTVSQVSIQVEDIGFKANSPAAGPAIEIKASQYDGFRIRPMLRNVKIGRTAVANYYTYGFKAWRVVGSKFDNVQMDLSQNYSLACIKLDESYACDVQDSTLGGAYHGVYHVIGGEGGLFNRVTITNVQIGIQINNDPTNYYMSHADCKILNSSISAKQYGAWIDWRNEVFISNNDFFSQAGDNAYTDVMLSDCDKSFVTGNRFNGAGANRTGITQYRSNLFPDKVRGGALISDNTFRAFKTGIYVGTNIFQTAIFSNAFIGTTAPYVDAGFATAFTAGAPDPFVSPANSMVPESLSWGTITNAGTYVYNVTNPIYAGGAKGDGNTPDTAAIRAAATAAVSYLNGGSARKAALYFPAGTYKILDQISLSPTNGSKLTIFGDGPKVSVILRAAGGTAGLFNIQAPATTGVEIQNLSLVAGYAAAGTAVYMKQSGTPTVRSLSMNKVEVGCYNSSFYFNNGLRGENLFAPRLKYCRFDVPSVADVLKNTANVVLTGGKGLECEGASAGGNAETGWDITSNGGSILFRHAQGIVLRQDLGVKINAGGGTVAFEGTHANCKLNFDITNAGNVSLVNTLTLDRNTPGTGTVWMMKLANCRNVNIRNNHFGHSQPPPYNRKLRTVWFDGTANANINIYGNFFIEPGEAYVYTQAGAAGPKVQQNWFVRTDVDDMAGPVSTVKRLYELNGVIGRDYLIKSKANGKYLAAAGTAAVDLTCSRTEVTDECRWNVVYTEVNGLRRYTLTNKKYGKMLQYVSTSDEVDCSGTLTNAYTKWQIVHRDNGCYTLQSGANLAKYLDYVSVNLVDCHGAAFGDDTTWQLILADDLVRGMERGTITPGITQTSASYWKTMNFLDPFHHPPAVFVGGPSCNDTNPITVRVKNVTSTGFQFQLDEWNDSPDNGAHSTEEVSFIAAHKGRYMLDGRTCEAGTITGVNTNWTTKTFSAAFPAAPCVFAQCTSTNGWSAVCTRVRNVTTTGFQVRLQESPDNTPHANETVDFIAIDPGSNPYLDFEVGRTNQFAGPAWKTLPFAVGGWKVPGFVGSVQSYYGPDPCALRYQADSLSSSNVIIKVDDENRVHNYEDIGWMVFDNDGGL